MTEEQLTMTHSTENRQSPQYLGIGGWLWLFIIIHMYIAPLLALLLQLTWWFMPDLGMSIGPSGGSYLLAVLRSAIFIGLAIYGFVAAWRLNGLRRGAVRFVKTFLVVSLVPAVLSAALPIGSADPDLPAFANSLLWSAIWFAYFSVSKRVKATYPESAPSPGTGISGFSIFLLLTILIAPAAFSQRVLSANEIRILPCGTLHRSPIVAVPPFEEAMPFDVRYAYAALHRF